MDAGSPPGASWSWRVASVNNRARVERLYVPDEEAQVRALRLLASSVNGAKKAAEQSGRKTLAEKEIHESSANKSSVP